MGVDNGMGAVAGIGGDGGAVVEMNGVVWEQWQGWVAAWEQLRRWMAVWERWQGWMAV